MFDFGVRELVNAKSVYRMAVVIFSTFTTWSWLSALSLGIAYVLIKWARTRRLVNLIPGPPQLPVIGNLYDIMCSPGNKDICFTLVTQ